MLPVTLGMLLISSGALCAPSDAVEVGVCDGDACSALKSSIGAAEEWRKELGCCIHADCLPSVTTILCAHDVMTRFFQNSGTSKVCSDFNEQCEALRVVKMNLQLSSNILGCHEREERAFISAPGAATHKLLEDLLPQSVVTAIHNVLPNSLLLSKVESAVGTAGAQVQGVALAGGHSNFKGNVYFFNNAVLPAGQWGAVCADGFTRNEADTVCRQLGFARAKEFFGVTPAGRVRGNKFGPVPNPFAMLSGVTAGGVGFNCPVGGAAIAACLNFGPATLPPPGTPACPSNEVAGVECAA
jgi:hypothetical protein